MTNFASLKRSSDSSLNNRLAKEIEKMNSPQGERQRDIRFWKPTVDKSGVGQAIIRFLPGSPADGDDGLPWVRVFDHGFKGPSGKWYIENSLTTIGKSDPVSELNSRLWKESEDDNSPQRKQARMQKRRLSYIANIYVISDPQNPESEGKVFLYKFGKKIFDKITALVAPEFEGEESINVFDFWKGANFRLKIKNVENFRNYDQSSFENPSPIFKDDAKIEEVWKSQYSLKEFVDPVNFKSYDELKARLEEVLGRGESPRAQTTVQKARSSPKAVEEVEDNNSAPFETDDDDLEAFRQLASSQ